MIDILQCFCLIYILIYVLCSPQYATIDYPDNSSSSNSILLEKGYVLCGAEKYRDFMIRTNYHLRYTWKSKLPIAYAHCDEISEGLKRYLWNYFTNIIFINICPKSIYHHHLMYKNSYFSRFRSYFCKPIALIHSPFNNTMLLDLDIIWFFMPEKVFQSLSYLQTGALFFRDKHVDMGWGNFPYQTFYNMFYDYANDHKDITVKQAKELFLSNGIVLFWGNKAYRGNFPILGHHQDSSVVVVNKYLHPKMLSVIEEFILEYSLGYGDKEMFWTSAVISKESFTFEPFFPGLYGNCNVLLYHYNPGDINKSIDQVHPLFLNGEWMVEDMKYIGEYVKTQVTKPVFVSDVVTKGHRNALFPVTECVCNTKGYECQRIPKHVYQMIILSQWTVLTAKLSRQDPTKECIPIQINHIKALNKIFSNIPQKDCSLIGCPMLPITVNSNRESSGNTNRSVLSKDGIFCDLVTFSDVNVSSEFKQRSAQMRGYI